MALPMGSRSTSARCLSSHDPRWSRQGFDRAADRWLTPLISTTQGPAGLTDWRKAHRVGTHTGEQDWSRPGLTAAPQYGKISTTARRKA